MPPKDVQKNVTPEFCKGHDHPLKLEEERAVARAGWLVFASYQDGEGLTVVGGAASEDGMCRPDPYQFFVFFQGRYAGTLSPRLMRARTDGSVNKVSFVDGKVVAAFSRYTPADPLCCPSRVSEATYEVGQESGEPVVKVVSVQTGRP
ncbi:MAG TPA: LppP/LprE family lipoprotein [Bryobacteraceae bacterium]|jgi:hypothetical protein